jgi:purine-nucleoside phosphorylase
MNALLDATGLDKPRLAIVLGSGLSDLAESLVGPDKVAFADVAGMPLSSVPGHEGALYFGPLEGTDSLVFAGRAHLYEGHDTATVTYAVRTAVEAGCTTVILTNAVGAIDDTLEVGAPCLIADHINLTGRNPLVGITEGPRFPDLSNLYDRELREIARRVDPSLKETVFAQMLGPSYETPAEIAMLRKLGAHTVGMSTAIEAIAAHQLGARVLGISVVTNLAAGVSSEPLSHEEVAAAGRSAAARLGSLIRSIAAAL